MKCIAYVSRIPTRRSGVCLPIGLSGIVRFSHRNTERGITGFLSYRQGCYLQVIEGPKQIVDDLMSRISTNDRHEDVLIFINTSISQRCFSRWEISVFDLINQDILYKKFIRGYRFELEALNEDHKNRIQHFFNIDNLNLDSANLDCKRNYQGKKLRLLAWPDFSLISNSQEIINLCVKLTKQPYPYDELIRDSQFGSPQQVLTTIEKFENMGILKVIEIESLVEQPAVVHKKKPSRFYSAIKKFLGMG